MAFDDETDENTNNNNINHKIDQSFEYISTIYLHLHSINDN